MTASQQQSHLHFYCTATAVRGLQHHESHKRMNVEELEDTMVSDSDHVSLKEVIDLLQIYPPGSLNDSDIQIAEHWLETLTSQRKPTMDVLSRAKWILMRLIEEHKFYVAMKEEKENVPNEFLRKDDERNDPYRYTVRPFLLNRVLDCWRKGWRDGKIPTAPTDVIAWIDQLETEFGIVADNRALTLVIDGICSRGNTSEAPLLAQWLLDRRMEQVYYAEDEVRNDAHDDVDPTTAPTVALRPDTIFISNVIRAWAKSERIEAPEMAEGLLQLMQDLYRNDWKNSGPNAMTYGVTMEAWYKSDRHEAAERILALLEEMKHSDLDQVVPDRVCYQYAINGLTNAKSKKSVDKAYQLLQEMIFLYQAGNQDVAPNASNFSQVMKGYVQQGDVEQAETILDQLQELYSTTRDPRFQPNDMCWKAMVIGKSKSGSTGDAEGMLDELIERALSSGNTFLMPSRGYFVDVLVGWTRNKDQVLAAKQSHRVLNRMIQLADSEEFQHLLPDGKTFDKVILAWSRSRLAIAPQRIQELLKMMQRLQIQPSLFGYTNLMLAWQRSGNADATNQVRSIFESLKEFCANGDRNLCPDKYAYGILFDALSQDIESNMNVLEFYYSDMVNEWKQGNTNAKPDTHVFLKLLSACLHLSDGTVAAEHCYVYIDRMNDLGLTMTLKTYGYAIKGLSQSDNPQLLRRASELVEEVLQKNRNGTIDSSSHKDYKVFLQLVANSSLPQRSKQAQMLLQSWPSRGRTHVPKELLPEIVGKND